MKLPFEAMKISLVLAGQFAEFSIDVEVMTPFGAKMGQLCAGRQHFPQAAPCNFSGTIHIGVEQPSSAAARRLGVNLCKHVVRVCTEAARELLPPLGGGKLARTSQPRCAPNLNTRRS